MTILVWFRHVSSVFMPILIFTWISLQEYGSGAGMIHRYVLDQTEMEEMVESLSLSLSHTSAS